MEDIVIKSDKTHNWRVWAGVIAFILVFLVGVWLMYSWWLAPWLSKANNLNKESVIVPGVESTDEDKDGLNLREETKLGTSDNLKDTDNDGVDDYKEFQMGLDPLNQDTDGDGYLDGIEVNSGHDPLKK